MITNLMFQCEFKLDLQYLRVHFKRMIFFFFQLCGQYTADTYYPGNLTHMVLSKAIGKYIFTFTWQILYFTLSNNQT